MNVIGSRPDGWWRDREGAVRRLVERLQEFASSSGDDVTVVFDVRPRGMRAGRYAPIRVGFARGRGPNAADREIVRRAELDEDPASLTVVTSDRDLADQVRELGTSVEPANRFREQLEN